QPAGGVAPRFGHGLDAAAASADQRELGGDEQAVDQHQHEHGDDGEHDGGDHAAPPGRSKLARATAVPSTRSTRRTTRSGPTGTSAPSGGRRPSSCHTSPPIVSTSSSVRVVPNRSSSTSTRTSPRTETRRWSTVIGSSSTSNSSRTSPKISSMASS